MLFKNFVNHYWTLVEENLATMGSNSWWWLWFKLQFLSQCKQNKYKKPTTSKNPQTSSVIEHIHQELGNILHTCKDEGNNLSLTHIVEEFITNALWVVYSTYHSRLQSTSSAAIFQIDICFDIPYTLYYWLKFSCTMMTKACTQQYQMWKSFMLGPWQLCRGLGTVVSMISITRVPVPPFLGILRFQIPSNVYYLLFVM